MCPGPATKERSFLDLLVRCLLQPKPRQALGFGNIVRRHLLSELSAPQAGLRNTLHRRQIEVFVRPDQIHLHPLARRVTQAQLIQRVWFACFGLAFKIFYGVDVKDGHGVSLPKYWLNSY